jgi:hypothetical protein
MQLRCHNSIVRPSRHPSAIFMAVGFFRLELVRLLEAALSVSEAAFRA